MKTTSNIWPLAAILAGALALRRKSRGVGSTNTERQLFIPFAEYDPTVDLYNERGELSDREPDYNDYVMQARERRMLSRGIIDRKTGDEYNPLDVYEVYSFPWKPSLYDEARRVGIFEGKQLQNLSYHIERLLREAMRNKSELIVYQNGKIVSKLNTPEYLKEYNYKRT